jgi:hypothetical protein
MGKGSAHAAGMTLPEGLVTLGGRTEL